MAVRRARRLSEVAPAASLTGQRRWEYSGWFDYPHIDGMKEFMDAAEVLPVQDRIRALDEWLAERGLLDAFEGFMSYMTKLVTNTEEHHA
jgi:hypothetical protein